MQQSQRNLLRNVKAYEILTTYVERNVADDNDCGDESEWNLRESKKKW